MIIAVSDLPSQQAIFDSLVAAAKNGNLELDSSVQRILDYKAAYIKPLNLNSADANPLNIAQVAQTSVTALRLTQTQWPLHDSKPLLVDFALAKPSQVEGQPPATWVGELWLKTFGPQTLLQVSTNPTQAEIPQVLKVAKRANSLVLATRDAFLNPAQATLVKDLIAVGVPAFVVALRGPYDLVSFPQVSNYLLTYSDSYASVAALIQAFKGVNSINGKLPVAIPGLYQIGAGLTS